MPVGSQTAPPTVPGYPLVCIRVGATRVHVEIGVTTIDSFSHFLDSGGQSVKYFIYLLSVHDDKGTTLNVVTVNGYKTNI